MKRPQRPSTNPTGYHTAHHVLHAIIRHAQRVNHQAPRNERHRHHQRHAHVQHQRIAGQALAAALCGKHAVSHGRKTGKK